MRDFIFVTIILIVGFLQNVNTQEQELGAKCNILEEAGYWGYTEEFEIVCIVRTKVQGGYIFNRETFMIEKCEDGLVEFIPKNPDQSRYPPTLCIEEAQRAELWFGWIGAGVVVILFSIVFVLLCVKNIKDKKQLNSEDERLLSA